MERKKSIVCIETVTQTKVLNNNLSIPKKGLYIYI